MFALNSQPARSFPGILFFIAVAVALALLVTGCLGGTSDAEPGAGVQPPPTATPAGDPGAGQRPAGAGVSVDGVDVRLLESFPLQAQAVISGNLADGCTTVDEIRTERTDNTFTLEIFTFRPQDKICTEALVPFTETVPLPIEGLPAGTYTVQVEEQTASFTLDVDNVLPDEG